MAEKTVETKPVTTGPETAPVKPEKPEPLTPYEFFVSPFQMMRRFTQDVDRMFKVFGYGPFEMPFEIANRLLPGPRTFPMPFAWAPVVDMFSRGDDLVITAELAGIKPEDVTIETEANTLIIRGESQAEQEEKKSGYWYKERKFGSFYRMIPLPPGVPFENAKAQFTNGVLEIVLPGAMKLFEPQRNRIPIQGVQPPVPAEKFGTTAPMPPPKEPVTGN